MYVRHTLTLTHRHINTYKTPQIALPATKAFNIEINEFCYPNLCLLDLKRNVF